MFEPLQSLDKKVRYTPLSGRVNHAAGYIIGDDAITLAELVDNLISMVDYNGTHILYLNDKNKVQEIQLRCVADFCSLKKSASKLYFLECTYFDEDFIFFADNTDDLDKVLYYVIKDRKYHDIEKLEDFDIPQAYNGVRRNLMKVFEAEQDESYYTIIFTITGYITVIK